MITSTLSSQYPRQPNPASNPHQRDLGPQVVERERGMKVLVVDDEQGIVDSVVYSLKKEGYHTLSASDAEQCLQLIRSERPDLVILDVMLPSGSGMDVCRIIRKNSSLPIIMLTARAEVADRVLGLELGADDYITKPFSMRELMARVRTVLRRTGGEDAERTATVTVADLMIDPARHVVTVRGVPVAFTLREFRLLYFLASYPDQVFTRQALIDRVWGDDSYVEERTVDVHVRWIREKIEEQPSHPRRLLTVRGVGYNVSSKL